MVAKKVRGKVNGARHAGRVSRKGGAGARGRSAVEKLLKDSKKMGDYHAKDLISNLPNSFLVFDKKMKCILSNKKYYEEFGTKEMEIVGKQFEKVIPEGLNKKEIRRKIEQVMKTGKPTSLFGLKQKNKSFDARIIYVKTPEVGEEDIVMLVLSNITGKTKSLNEMNLLLENLKKEESALLEGTKIIGQGRLNYKYDLKRFENLRNVAATLNFTTTSLEELMKVSEKQTLALVKKEEMQKQYAKNLKTTIDHLKEMDKIKTNFLSITSHELKTPLTPVTIQLQLLLSGTYGGINDEQKKSIEVVLRNIKRLSQIINNVAVSSKMIRGKVKLDVTLTDIKSVIINSVDDVSTMSRARGIRIEISAQKVPKIILDQNRFSQIIVNLLTNAIKFNKDRGNIWIKASVKGRKSLVVSVKDSGIGIPKENQKKLFTPFYQVDSSRKRMYGGTGLGLSICKDIVELMGGKIWVESKVGEGSTFTFSIPIKNVGKGGGGRSGVLSIEPPQIEFYKKETLIETGPALKDMIDMGFMTTEGTIVSGLKFYDLEEKLSLDYKEMIKELISKMQEIIKDDAITKANGVGGLLVVYRDVMDIRISGNPKRVLGDLLKMYKGLLGYIVDSIEEDIVKKIVLDYVGGGEIYIGPIQKKDQNPKKFRNSKRQSTKAKA